MSFVDLRYPLLLVVVVVAHLAAGRWGARPQNVVLAAAGVAVAGAVHPWFVLVLGAVIGVNYGCSVWISERLAAESAGATGSGRARHGALVLATVATVGTLLAFKYNGFFVENIKDLAGLLGFGPVGWGWELAVPLGLSYFTLQCLGYTLDVARGEQVACRDPLQFFTFGLFFPSLGSGPILRSSEVLPVLARVRGPGAEEVEEGLLLLAWGYFKKLVVAATLAPMVDGVFALKDASSPLLAFAAYAFTLQLYADFSGYTDIARGSALLLGFRLPANFNHPLLASSLTDFWRRWHLSLTRWLRDYVYFPLAGSRPGLRADLALLGTMFISGLWHGPAWNFVMWGLVHGVGLWLERTGTRLGLSRWTERRVFTPLRVMLTFSFVATSLLIFRETDGLRWVLVDLSRAPWEATWEDQVVAAYFAGVALIWTAPVWAAELYLRLGGPRPGRWARVGLVLVLVGVARLLGDGEGQSFLYAGF